MSAGDPTRPSVSSPGSPISEDLAPRPASQAFPCVIERGARFQGLLAFDASARVEGSVHGRVAGSGLLEIARGADVEGQVRARVIVVSGQLSGEVRAEERIVVTPGGELRGHIETAGLEIGDGATVEGPVTMKTPSGEALDRESRLNLQRTL